MEVETQYENPYEKEFENINAEIVMMYDKYKKCVEYILENNILANSSIIVVSCLGLNFSILNEMFQQKMDQISEIYIRLLIERFDPIKSQNSEEIEFFIQNFQLLIKKGYANIFLSLQIIGEGAQYHINQQVYFNLLEISREILNYITDYHQTLKLEKLKLKKDIKKDLDLRDEKLKTLLQAGVDNESLKDAFADVTNQHENLGDQLKGLNQQIIDQTQTLLEDEDTEKGNAIDDSFNLIPGTADKSQKIDFVESTFYNEKDDGLEDMSENSDSEQEDDDNKKHSLDLYDENEEPNEEQPPLNLTHDLFRDNHEFEITNFITQFIKLNFLKIQQKLIKYIKLNLYIYKPLLFLYQHYCYCQTLMLLLKQFLTEIPNQLFFHIKSNFQFFTNNHFEIHLKQFLEFNLQYFIYLIIMLLFQYVFLHLFLMILKISKTFVSLLTLLYL